jgi:serine/threonine protein kinase
MSNTQGLFDDDNALSPPVAPRATPATAPPAPAEAPGGTQAFAFLQGSSSSSSSEGPPVDIVGRNLKHFRIDRRLAAGGMGEVFLAYDTSLSRPVAIKTIRPELTRDPEYLARFVREAKAQANVVHPAVVQVYFIGEDQGVWFIAMQVVDGGSLHDVLHSRRITWQEAARHMTSLVEGLEVAARLGIVHRDIKPANILLDRKGRVHLGDFGLAIGAGTVPSNKGGAVSAPSGSQVQLAGVTEVGVVMGTPEYVAPEQLRIGAIDERADIYALGATFYHLLTGKPPLELRTLTAAVEAHANNARIPPLRELAPQVPKAFAAVIDTCLARDRDSRYASMSALREALFRVQPQPDVPASGFSRALVWLLDVAPFLVVSKLTYSMWPLLGPLLFLLAGVVGLAVAGTTPGIWLLRLRLRTVDDGDVSLARGFVRFLVQHGWYVPLTIGFSAIYESSPLMGFFVVGLVWLAISVLGSLGALFGRRQTLHDFVTKTRVLVDVRSR